jgi:hypothetical protein
VPAGFVWDRKEGLQKPGEKRKKDEKMGE